MGGDIAFAAGATWASTVAGGWLEPLGTFIGAAAGFFVGLGSSIGYILANDNRIMLVQSTIVGLVTVILFRILRSKLED